MVVKDVKKREGDGWWWAARARRRTRSVAAMSKTNNFIPTCRLCNQAEEILIKETDQNVLLYYLNIAVLKCYKGCLT